MDDQRAKAAATFGADFMREARATPALPSNSMVASQANANSRPIPTFAKGGKVVKAVRAFKKMDQKADAPLVAKAVRSVVKKASGGGVLGTKASPVSAVKVKPGVTVAARPAAAARKEAIISRRASGGPIAKCAAGGTGKVRKGQAKEPGRGPKLDNAF